MCKTNNRSLLRHILAASVVFTTMTACDSSVGTNSDAGKLVVTRGTVSDTATVTVNGRAFSTARADIVIDDQLSTLNSLRTGMQVTVQSQNSSATLIQYDEEVKGPVDSLNSDGSLSVMGQTIFTTDTTILDSSPIVSGDIVEVSGMRDANDTIHATYIEKKNNLPNSYEVRGNVAQLNTNNQTFLIGRLSVNYSAARFDNLSSSSLANGDFLEVKDQNLQYEPGSFLLRATKIERYRHQLDLNEQNSSSSSNNSNQQTEIEIEAYVTQILSDESFRIGSLTVIILPDTRFRDGQRSELQVNSRVEVEGWLNNNGDLEAWEIEFDDASDYYDSDDDDSSDSDSESSNSNSGSGSSGNDDDNEVELAGIVTAINPADGSFMINGIVVQVGSRTEFENGHDQSISRSEFFTSLTSGQTVVKVKWKRFTNYSDVPHEVEIEF